MFLAEFIVKTLAILIGGIVIHKKPFIFFIDTGHDSAFDDIAFFKKEGGFGGVIKFFHDPLPVTQELMSLVDEHICAGISASGAANEAHIMGHFKGADEFFELFTGCFILDFARDAAVRRIWQKN